MQLWFCAAYTTSTPKSTNVYYYKNKKGKVNLFCVFLLGAFLLFFFCPGIMSLLYNNNKLLPCVWLRLPIKHDFLVGIPAQVGKLWRVRKQIIPKTVSPKSTCRPIGRPYFQSPSLSSLVAKSGQAKKKAIVMWFLFLKEHKKRQNTHAHTRLYKKKTSVICIMIPTRVATGEQTWKQ